MNDNVLYKRDAVEQFACANHAGGTVGRIWKVALVASDNEIRPLDALLERFISERAALTPPPAQSNPELPVWHLGGVGALHRRDIYDDAR